jgi:hypothetical protein
MANYLCLMQRTGALFILTWATVTIPLTSCHRASGRIRFLNFGQQKQWPSMQLASNVHVITLPCNEQQDFCLATAQVRLHPTYEYFYGCQFLALIINGSTIPLGPVAQSMIGYSHFQ